MLYERFLEDLSDLVSWKTLFWQHEAIEPAMGHCQRRFEQRLPGWSFHRDEAGNLLVTPPWLDASREILYLTAHLDTVDADPSEWEGELDPFTPRQTVTHLIGRGVNDCKAGVAFMLHVATLMAEQDFPRFNGGFCVTFQEEGNQSKTSAFYVKSLGKTLPLSERTTYFMTLENTVSLKDCLEIAVYDQEPCNAFIRIQGTVPQLRALLLKLPEWKPTVIIPDHASPEEWKTWSFLEQEGGHSCTVPNETNAIHHAIFSEQYDDVFLACGDPHQTSVVAQRLYWGKSDSSPTHGLILNRRAVVDVETIRESLAGIPYEEVFDFTHASGSDQKDFMDRAPFKSYMESLGDEDVSVVFTPNPGRSDSSMIWNALPAEWRGRVLPFTCGPGHRSHQDGSVRRKTHGANEGFHKDVGEQLMPYFLRFLDYFKLSR